MNKSLSLVVTIDPNQANLTFFYSTFFSASIPLQLFLRSLSTALFSFLNRYLETRKNFAKGQVFPCLKTSRCIFASSWVPRVDPSFCCTNLFFGPFSLMLYSDGFLILELPMFLSRNAITERLVAPSTVASRHPTSPH